MSRDGSRDITLTLVDAKDVDGLVGLVGQNCEAGSIETATMCAPTAGVGMDDKLLEGWLPEATGSSAPGSEAALTPVGGMARQSWREYERGRSYRGALILPPTSVVVYDLVYAVYWMSYDIQYWNVICVQ